jgi:multiple sugar transport system permease protein
VLRTLIPGRSPVFYQNLVGLSFAVPAIAFLLVFNVYPLLNAIYLSFTSWKLAGTPEFIGLDNYVEALTSDIEVLRSVRTTLSYTFGLIPGFAIALLLAILMNRPFRGKELLRTVYFTPVVISWVIASLVWYSVLHPSFGLNAAFFRMFGQKSISFFTEPAWVVPTFIVLSIWKGVGYWMVIFLAGLQGIPQDYYEAASVDGANHPQKFWNITVPLLRPTILFVSVIGFINAFQAFVPIYILTRGGPAGASRVFTMLIYEAAFTYFKMGYASALAVLLFIILMAVSLIQMRALRTEAN